MSFSTVPLLHNPKVPSTRRYSLQSPLGRMDQVNRYVDFVVRYMESRQRNDYFALTEDLWRSQNTKETSEAQLARRQHTSAVGGASSLICGCWLSCTIDLTNATCTVLSSRPPPMPDFVFNPPQTPSIVSTYSH